MKIVTAKFFRRIVRKWLVFEWILLLCAAVFSSKEHEAVKEKNVDQPATFFFREFDFSSLGSSLYHWIDWKRF